MVSACAAAQPVKEEEDGDEEVAGQAETIVELGFDGQILNMVVQAGAWPTWPGMQCP